MGFPGLLLSLLAPALSFLGFAPQGSSVLPPGAAAQPGTWALAGGSPSRSGLSLSRPLLSEPGVAWSFGPATFEGEPRVWESRVFAALHEGGSQRSLVVLDLETGLSLTRQRLSSDRPLEPSVWWDRVAVRAGASAVQVFQLRGRRLFTIRTLRHARSMSAPLLFEDELYVREGDTLACYDFERSQPLWRLTDAGRVRGTPSLRGRNVYVCAYDDAGNAAVLSVDRKTGTVTGRVRAGHHGGSLPDQDADVRLVVTDRQVFLHHALPVAAADGDSFRWGRLPLRNGELSPGSASLHDFMAEPVDWAGGWIVRERSETGGPRWSATRAQDARLRSRYLAEGDTHRWLVDTGPAPARTAELLYLGAAAVTADEMNVRWRRDGEIQERPVPVDNGLLIVQGRQLIHLSRPDPEPTPAEKDAARLEAELDRVLAKEIAGVALEALRIGAVDEGAAYLNRATALGAEDRTLAPVRRSLEPLLSAKRRRAVDPRLTERLATRAQRLEDRPIDDLVSRATDLDGDELARRLLSAALERRPDHPLARRRVQEWLPEGAPTTAPFDAPSWLEFLDIHARNPVTFLDPLSAGRRTDTAGTTLTREVRRWRADLTAYGSERLFVITPPGRPAAVARCLEIGEAVCDLLEGIFPGTPPKGAGPLPLLLFETRDEYVAHSQKNRSGPELALGWTAGHYSPPEGLSRMFVPEDDAEQNELLGVYAHELTHHWLSERSPMASRRGGGTRNREGYWLVEGFASMIEEFEYDPATASWDPESPRAGSLDKIANAPISALLPWDRVLELNHRGYTQLSNDKKASLTLTWQLGVRAPVSDLSLFYAQSAALAHYLYSADEGRHRRVLLDHVESWYRGTAAPPSPLRALGLSPEDLGTRIIEYARARTAPRSSR